MTEHEKARAWADKRNLSAQQLADLTGYGVRAINWFWLGQSPPSGTRAKAKKVSPWVWQRFKTCCAGVEMTRGGKKFEW